jgi:hypothetical protein
MHVGSEHTEDISRFFFSIFIKTKGTIYTEELYYNVQILFLCEISSSHGGEYEVQICLLGCTAV